MRFHPNAVVVVRIVLSTTLAIAICPAGRTRADDAAGVAKGKAARLEQMELRARSAVIHFVDGDRDRKIDVHPQPLLRYNDTPRGFRDATLWLWIADGRPVAIEKVEDLRTAGQGPRWLTCMASLAPEKIETRWDGGQAYAFKKPGVEFRALKGAPPPEPREAGRLRQFKAQAQRFSATLQQFGTDDRQEMRLLTRPLHRYAIPGEEVGDAIIFAWTANGTNPDALLVIEQRARAKQAPEWVYSLVGVTADTVDLKLDGETVQTKVHTMYPGDETLTFFFEPNVQPID